LEHDQGNLSTIIDVQDDSDFSEPQLCTLEVVHTNIADLLVKYKANLDYRANLYSVCVFTRAKKLLVAITALLRLYYGAIKALIRFY
jgi:hypothetical protein